MERRLAEAIVKKFNEADGPTLSLFEAMAMTEVISNGRKVYALQKGDVAFLVWIQECGHIVVKTVRW